MIMPDTKIVFIGAGSVLFGAAMLRDLFYRKDDLKGSVITLVDIDKEALDRMYAATCEMNKITGAGFKLEKTTNRREALPGADFVVSSICIERNALWRLDFEVPKKYGIRHCLGENGGPGALFFSLRTLPMVLDILRDMEELCPDAYFLNFSNPESRIILAAGRYTKIKSVGLCHGVFMGHCQAAKILEVEPDKISTLLAGLNHFQWLLEVRDSITGEDLYPKLREKDKTYDPLFEPFSRKLFKAFDYFPSCGGDHIGEYLPYGYEAGEHGCPFDAADQYRLDRMFEIDERIAGRMDWDEWMHPSGERGADIIAAKINNKKTIIESGIVYNSGGVISNLPKDAAVEVPIAVDITGIHPFNITLPDPLARMLTAQVMIQQMAVDAAVNASKEMALQTLLMDPVINSTDAAVKLLDELWDHNKQYIRKCI